MSENVKYLTEEQHAHALDSVKLLTKPLQNVSNIAWQIARNAVVATSSPHVPQLISTPQVVTGLATLQSAVQDLSRAYIAHTNTVIGKGPGSSLELLNLANPLGDNGLFGQRAATPVPTTEAVDGKKPKARRPHDKNAPKRALTPYFLYMQTARPLLAASKPKATARQIADEGTKRWAEMEEDEKAVWQKKYAVNFVRYKEKVKAYKAGLPIPEITDSEAEEMYEDQKAAGIVHKIPKDNITVPPVEDEEEEEVATVATSSAGEEDESPEPPKAPTPPKSSRASKRQKTTKDGGEKVSSPVKPAKAKESTESPVAERSSQSPEKERKKKSLKKKSTDEPSAKKVAAAVAETSPAKEKKEKKSRKRKSVADVD